MNEYTNIDPWALQDAFAPMFNEDVEVVVGDCRFTLKCFVSADSNGEVLSEDMLQTDRRDINLFVRQ